MLTSADTGDRWSGGRSKLACATNTTSSVSDIDKPSKADCGSLLYAVGLRFCLQPPRLWFFHLPNAANLLQALADPTQNASLVNCLSTIFKLEKQCKTFSSFKS